MDSKLPNPRKGLTRNLGIYLLLIALAVAIFIGIGQVNKPPGETKDISTIIGEIRSGQVNHVSISGNTVQVTLNNGSVQNTQKESQDSFVKILTDAGIKPDSVPITVKDDTGNSVWLSLLFGSVLPILVMVVIFYFLIRQARSAGDNLFAF
jgi:ATP-dependent Zn protease